MIVVVVFRHFHRVYVNSCLYKVLREEGVITLLPALRHEESKRIPIIISVVATLYTAHLSTTITKEDILLLKK